METGGGTDRCEGAGRVTHAGKAAGEFAFRVDPGPHASVGHSSLICRAAVTDHHPGQLYTWLHDHVVCVGGEVGPVSEPHISGMLVLRKEKLLAASVCDRSAEPFLPTTENVWLFK